MKVSLPVGAQQAASKYVRVLALPVTKLLCLEVDSLGLLRPAELGRFLGLFCCPLRARRRRSKTRLHKGAEVERRAKRDTLPRNRVQVV